MQNKENGIKSAMIDSKLTAKLVELARSGPNNVVFLTGAGVSASSEACLWYPMKRELFADLFDNPDAVAVEKALRERFRDEAFLRTRVFEDGTDPKYFKDAVEYLDREIELPPELLLAFFRKQYGDLELQDFLKRHLGRIMPSPVYAAFGRVFETGFSRVYLTVNQDGLIEQRIAQVCGPERLFVLSGSADIGTLLEKNQDPPELHDLSRILIANLHGTFTRLETLALSPANLLPVANGTSKGTPIGLLLSQVLHKARALIVIGYRGKDRDVMDVLAELLQNKSTAIETKICVDSGRPSLTALEPFTHVQATADEFLTALFEQWQKASKPVHPQRPLITSAVQSSTSVVVSGPGTVILAGDYGVYDNGLMIQLRLPSRVWAVRTERAEDDCQHYDPRTGRYVKDKQGLDQIAAVRDFLVTLRDRKRPEDWSKRPTKFEKELPADLIKALGRQIDFLADAMQEYDLSHIEQCSIHASSEFPSHSGAGDVLASVVLGALLFPPAGREYRIEQLAGNLRDLLLRLSAFWYWLHTYSNVSYLRPLASFWNGGAIFQLDRRYGEPDEFRALREEGIHFQHPRFALANLSVDPVAILDRGVSLSMPNIDFAIAYRPRRAVLSKMKEIQQLAATTGHAVGEIHPIEQSCLIRALGAMTEQMSRPLASGFDPRRLGKLLSAYHFGLVGLLRGSPEVDALVGELAGEREVYGAKTSGAGPGGILVIAYDPGQTCEQLSNPTIRRLIRQRGHHLLLTSVLDQSP